MRAISRGLEIIWDKKQFLSSTLHLNYDWSLSKVPSFLRKTTFSIKQPNLTIKCKIRWKNRQKAILRFFWLTCDFRRLVWPRLWFFIRFHHLWVIERLSLIMLHWNLVSFSFFDIREVWDSLIAPRSSTPNFLQFPYFLSLSKIERDGFANPLIIVVGFLSLRKQILSPITTVGYTRWRIWIKKSETREQEKLPSATGWLQISSGVA